MDTANALPHTHSVPPADPVAPLTDSASPPAASPERQGGFSLSRRAVAFRIALHEQEARDVPEWVQLLPAGLFGGRDGRGPYLLDETAVLRAFSAGGMDLPVDYEHQTLEASERKGPVPAAGWIEALEVRGGELWARVSWTPRAAELIAAREYRYLSPVFRHDEGGRIVRIEGAALTHYPNLDLAPVAHTTAPTFAPAAGASVTHCPPGGLRAPLGGHAARAHEIQNGGNTVTKDIKQAEPIPPEPEQTGLPAATHAQEPGAPAAQTVDPTQWVPMAQFRKVADELSGLREKMKREAAEAAVANAIEAGKLAPAMKDWASGYALADPDGFAAYCAAAPAMLAGESLQRVACNSRTGDGLTEEDIVACALLNIDRAAFAEHKARTAPTE